MSVGADARHLQADEIAAYVDGTATSESRASTQSHLVACAACRAEVGDAWRIVHTLSFHPMRRAVWRRAWIPAIAAAAAVLLLVRPRMPGSGDDSALRESAVTTIMAPRPTTPVGIVDSTTKLGWSSVPAADHYEARLFDSDGTVMWEGETRDTVATLPPTVVLQTGRAYYWRVEALSTLDRGATSELVEFVIRSPTQRGER